MDRNAGFCGGVRRAIRGTEKLLSKQLEAREDRRIVSYGQLVHNREVTDGLSAGGLKPLESLEEAAPGDTVVLRTHGISPQEQRLLRSRGLAFRDFTCPRVKKVHEQIREKREAGYRIVIVGDPGHPEVRAHLGHAGETGVVLSVPQDAERLPVDAKIAVFAQTTITPQSFQEILDALEHRGLEMAVVNTLCPFVMKRQRWIAKYSRIADASLILGGRNSSNTRKLHALAAANGPAFHLSRPEELEVDEVLQYPVVALTAGASTSDRTIREVIGRLEAAGARIERR
ncbi:MAG: 4-hydroxy-3-methylbut-2-enyl diphosphate reductase [Spirochaetales bacterium]|nr:4-hydroxy-3-methylbut-2-enyl diphosphate reductase [Spirochaetales bacterium]